MGYKQAAQGLVLLVVASLSALSNGETIVVGGSEKWHFGFNYTDWSLKHGRFCINDVLVFKYDPPSNTTPPHDVYLMPNLWSYMTCDFRKATLLADATKGGGKGFSYKLRKWKPHYFACSKGNGVHCKVGMMKFFAIPWPRWHS